MTATSQDYCEGKWDDALGRVGIKSVRKGLLKLG